MTDEELSEEEKETLVAKRVAERCKEIYQRVKKENPCIFCVQYDDGCQLKGNKCDSTSLRMYYEKRYQEIEPYLKNTYINELEKENEQLQKNNKHIRDLIEAERQRQEECNDVHLRDIATLEKENELLAKRICELQSDLSRAKSQIEKMKCCRNCEHFETTEDYGACRDKCVKIKKGQWILTNWKLYKN